MLTFHGRIFDRLWMSYGLGRKKKFMDGSWFRRIIWVGEKERVCMGCQYLVFLETTARCEREKDGRRGCICPSRVPYAQPACLALANIPLSLLTHVQLDRL
jgi:hypothetical protein